MIESVIETGSSKLTFGDLSELEIETIIWGRINYSYKKFATVYMNGRGYRNMKAET